MGGSGSGSWYRWGTRDTTAGYKAIDVNFLHRAGYLRPGQRLFLSWTRGGQSSGSIGGYMEEGQLVLRYRSGSPGGEWEDMEYAVRLTRTPCNYGGYRPWFLCPHCGRRVGKLYGGRRFLCRHCHRLAYQSQNESPWDRVLRKAQDIRLKLGGTVSMADSFPDKPKGMHWRTYNRLWEEYEHLEARLDFLTVRWLDSLHAPWR